MFLTNQQIHKIINQPMLYFTDRDYLHGMRELDSIGRILSLIVYDYEMGENYPDAVTVREGIKHSLKKIMYFGCEPTFDNCHNWGYPALA